MSRIYPCIYCTDDLHCTKYTDDNYESWCVLGPCQDETPTNADRIRSMTDEELAHVLRNPCDIADHGPTGWCKERNCGYQCALEWLKQEATDGS